MQTPGAIYILEKDRDGHCIRPKVTDCSEQTSAWRWLRDRLSKAPEKDVPRHKLTHLATTKRSCVYSAQSCNQTYMVKLCKGNKAEDELQTQIVVYNHMGQRWHLVRRCLQLPLLPAPGVPRPGAKVVRRRCLGISSSVEGFVMQYMPPIHVHQRAMLIKKYMDPSLQEDALASPEFSEMRLKLHMGELAAEHNRPLGQLQDRPVFFDEIWAECRQNVPEWATMMGGALAILHWSCDLDVRGVKFRVGHYKGRNRLWISDFGDCVPIEQHQVCVGTSMVVSVMENPTWPRPPVAPNLGTINDPNAVLLQTWQRFRDSYLASSAEVLFERKAPVSVRRLPGIFICKLEALWRVEAGVKLSPDSDAVSSLYMTQPSESEE